MKTPKIVFTDIDGTAFYNNKQIVLPSTIDAISQLRAQGTKIMACTSRSYQEMLQMKKEFFDYVDGTIAGTGSIVHIDNKLLKVHTLNQQETEYIIKLFEDNNIIYRYVTEDQIGYLNQYDEAAVNLFNNLYGFVPDIKKYEGEVVSHMLCYLTDNNTLYQTLVENLKYTHILKLNRAKEILYQGINKGSSIIETCELLNIDLDDVAVFGDGHNDIDMFHVVNKSICMGQAHDEVKKHANYVTDRIEDDGFYNACKHFGWIK